ncbi:ATP-dependent acyl-CoA ligase [Vineibacter terrae]|uniref:ATP-dependent acyl-CoA ligase n=1 Tax=Vineibacter terrae TaxID=2586908 RepID=A0A5C8PS62_9HYPH|nr:AMP-binding protein [Vineibacter terrae]TXL79570.1 ATP-dependent acyl-CoA ligase [Vineibacter terrae]
MSAAWHDRRVPPPEACVLRPLLDRRAQETPDKVFVQFAASGQSWTYAALRRIVVETAAALQELGVAQDDPVLTWMPNGPDALRLWFAINYLGAVHVPLNLAYRGQLLEHAVRTSGARLILGHPDLLPRLEAVSCPSLAQRLAVATSASITAPGGEPRPPARDIMPWDTQHVIYTSGTTGPSKGVLCSYLQAAETALAFHAVTADDRNMVNLPLFHAGGTNAVYRMLLKGGSIALVEAFDTASFWDTIRATGTTCLTLLGAMVPFLLKAPPTARDRDHPLSKAMVVPLSDEAQAFAERFGVDIYTTFNMTETSCPLVSERNPTVRGTCGRPRPGVEARIVDENDCEVAPGAIGELILRTDVPWAMNHGYHNNPEATARAWRNGWFHTGDGFRRDEAGNFFFVDRLKDAIRRRGENVSSFEVEAELMAHPDVREAAAVAVPSEHGEDEVLAVIAPVADRRIDPADLLRFLLPRMAHFMVPRYVRILPELPKTPTQKVQKKLLRDDGVTADTWDREAAGIRIRRERLATTPGTTP